MCLILGLNAIVGQGFKRFIWRKRPYQFQPPRAFLLEVAIQQQRSSSFTSRVVTTGTTMAYALLMHSRNMTLLSLWAIALLVLAIYLATSVSRVHFGLIYPSDCLLSLIPIVLIMLLYTLINSRLSKGDPVPLTNPLTLNNYYFSELATHKFWLTLSIGTIIFIGLTSYPIEFWRKTLFMFGTLLGYMLFRQLNLSPSEGNGQKKIEIGTLIGKGPLQLVVYTYLVLNFMVIFVVNTLLGRRTGHLLSIIIRTVFFLAIVAETASVLTAVRLIAVQ
ncbi:hypothetical protein FGO68_gene4190 [Halteria grandinella]|uniref:Uncharacterized protein n=1 Tax=Halteria grandinella TaxID=5974 RepID=A0A8J8P1N9_HALGN|nr:hypothetical protein FGO68_gene4190 [Halteria grandinella]